VNRQSVTSSNVKEVGWEPDEDAGSDEQKGKNGTLEVEFHSGHVYQYFNVPEQVFRALVTADSPGRALNRDVIGRYEEDRVS
jgi:hypothetical protein